MSKQILDLQNIEYSYPGRVPIFKNFNFRLYEGERIGLLAPNGSGKTTLFHIIMGLIRPISGKMKIFGKIRKNESDFFEVRKRIGLLFQDSDDQLFCPTVLDDVAFGPLNLKKSRKEAVSTARETLKFLGIEALEERVTHNLSGGEKRMVSLATILSMKPEVLLLDEPSSGLDEETKNRLVNVLNCLNVTYLIVSHDFDLLSKTTSKTLTIQRGALLFDQSLCVHAHRHFHCLGRHPHEHN